MISGWRMTGRRGCHRRAGCLTGCRWGALTKTFPPELVDQVVEVTDTREVRRGLLPARLVVYFVLALWLFRGRNCGYGRVLSKLVDGLYHRRRGRQLLDGALDPDRWVDAGQGRRWRPPNISNLSRARARSAARPTVRPTVRARVRPVIRWRGCSAAGCGWSRWTVPPATCRTPRRT